MSLRRRFLSLVLPLAALAASASSLAAQGRALFQWSGRVDREIQLAMRGRDAWTNSRESSDRWRGRWDVDGTLPRAEGEVRVRVLDGRGDVDVIQQPSARNDYTTIVRVRDRSGGADRYRIAASWVPASGVYSGRVGGGDVIVGGRGRSDDRDRYDDRRRDDRRDDGRYDDCSDRDGWGRRGGSVSLAHWSGNVDGEVEIRLRGDQASYLTVRGAEPRDVRMAARTTIPQRAVDVTVANVSGRGEVAVVQQPSARNGYTTIVRVRDPQGGYGYYDFDLVWR